MKNKMCDNLFSSNNFKFDSTLVKTLWIAYIHIFNWPCDFEIPNGVLVGFIELSIEIMHSHTKKLANTIK